MFEIGDKVICVDNKNLKVPCELKEGATYTVRGILDVPEGIGIYLEEIELPLSKNGYEMAFRISRFQKTSPDNWAEDILNSIQKEINLEVITH